MSHDEAKLRMQIDPENHGFRGTQQERSESGPRPELDFLPCEDRGHGHAGDAGGRAIQKRLRRHAVPDAEPRFLSKWSLIASDGRILSAHP